MQNFIKLQIKNYIEEFKTFMNIKEYPNCEIDYKTVSLDKAIASGYDSSACAKYDFVNKNHVLTVSTNLLITKELIFHELTHILDGEIYVGNDKIKYATISGYTEYHASQVEIMCALGAKSIADKISFSMNDTIDTFVGKKKVCDYVSGKLNHAIELFSRKDFPTDIATLKTAVGVLCNYFGLRSVCELYATDYSEKFNGSAFLKFIPSQNFILFNNLMHGWLSDFQVDLAMRIYWSIIAPIIKDYKL